MKIGLLGGSFNPAHIGHLHISELALKKLKLDQVWWVLTSKNPLKDANIYESYVCRAQKCENLIQGHPKIHLSQFDEIYTEKLLENLNKKYKGTEFIWIMGADNLENFHRWKGFKNIIKNNKIAIFSRENYLSKIKKTKVWNFMKNNQPKIFFTKKLDISSSKIRKNEI